MRVPLYAMAVAVALVVLGTLQTTANTGADAQSMTITVSPSQPTPTDSISITVTGATPCGNNTVTSSHQVIGNEISVVVDMAQPEICLTVVGRFDAVASIGMLPLGDYTVRATLNAPCCFPCDSPPCVEVAEFTVVTSPKALPRNGGLPTETGNAPIALDKQTAIELALGLLATALAFGSWAARHRG